MKKLLTALLSVSFVFVAAGKGSAADKPLTIAMMPKSKGNAYFISCRKGAEQAAKDLGVKLLWDGPTEPDPARQNEIVETWITRGVDVIAVSVENREGLSTALRKAKEKGIKIITWDADAESDARDFLINQATPEGIGYTLMDEAAKALGDKGEFAIITSSLTAANQNEWIKYIKQRLEEKYPDIKLAALRPCDDSEGQGVQRGDRNPQLESQRQGPYGRLLAGRSRSSGSRQAKRSEGRESRRPWPAQREQALRARWHHHGRYPLEHRRSRLSDRLRGEGRCRWHPQTRCDIAGSGPPRNPRSQGR